MRIGSETCEMQLETGSRFEKWYTTRKSSNVDGGSELEKITTLVSVATMTGF